MPTRTSAPVNLHGISGRADREVAIQEIVRVLNGIFQEVDVFSRRTLRQFGVSGPQIWALRTIASSEGVTMGDLARRLYLHPSTVSGIVDRLEARELVVRSRKEEDSRVVLLRLTRKGQTVLERAPEPPRSKVAKGLEKLHGERLEVLLIAIRTLGSIMQVPGQGTEVR